MIRPSRAPQGTTSIPHSVSQIDELSPDLRGQADLFLPDDDKVRTILEIPSGVFQETRQIFRVQTKRALLFTKYGLLHVQAPPTQDQAVRAQYIKAQELLYLRLSLLEWYGRLEIVSGMDSQLVRSEVEYNTQGQKLLQPALFKFLKKSWSESPPKKLDPEIAAKAEQDLVGLNPHYSNSLRSYGLQPEEHLLGIVFQPAIHERSWVGFPHQISFPALLALTEHQVIVLEEEKSDAPKPSGWIFTFIPRAAIVSIGTHPMKTHQILTFNLKRSDTRTQLEFHLDQPQSLDWSAIWGNDDV